MKKPDVFARMVEQHEWLDCTASPAPIIHGGMAVTLLRAYHAKVVRLVKRHIVETPTGKQVIDCDDLLAALSQFKKGK